MRTLLLLSLLATTSVAHAADVTPQAVLDADPKTAIENPNDRGAMAKVQILLDRAGASPVVIDGYDGQNTTSAIRGFERMKGLEVDGKLDADVIAALTEGEVPPVLVEYEITQEDASRKLVDIPDDPSGEALSKFDCMCFERHSEALAERFHMDEDFLKALNPDADFSKAGTKIMVADPGEPVSAKVARIEISKADEMLLAFDADDKLVFSARTSVGSEETPSPSGEMKVAAVAGEPTYTWNAKKNLGGESSETFQIAAGPNGPVGAQWIDLEKDTYGIHGTPDPSEIGRAESHGCVRLTNWDATELSKLVTPGETVVSFKD